jgi:hypothetical protein
MYIKKDLSLLDNFYVVTVISNPVRYDTRYELFEQFIQHMNESGVKVMVVEVAHGNRAFKVTTPDNPLNIQLRTNAELWHKENMINIGISRLPGNWEYVAWIDADISFTRKDWAAETVQQLQHYQMVQLWDSAVDLGPNHETISTSTSFGYYYAKGIPMAINWKKYYSFGHPGFAWAARREALNSVGGLIDRAILGAADHHMAWALIGDGQKTYPGFVTDAYKNIVLNWQQKAVTHIKKNIGYVPGTILHYWHGKKKDRAYVDRWEILHKYPFDPMIDLKRDCQGLFQLEDNKIELRDAIRRYFRQRNEDSIDLI